jgi:serine/threonine protein kinase
MPDDTLTPYPLLLRWTCDLLAGVAHLYRHRVLHLDMKPDNVMLAGDESLVIVDFGLAMHFPLPDDPPARRFDRREARAICRTEVPDPVTEDTWRALDSPAPFAFTYGELSMLGKQPYGNVSHAAPELQNAIAIASAGRRTDMVIDYTKQAVFDAGVLICEMMAGVHPLGDYPTSVAPALDSPEREHTPAIRPYGPEALRLPAHVDGFPDAFLAMVRRMVLFNPADRPSVGEALRFFWDTSVA